MGTVDWPTNSQTLTRSALTERRKVPTRAADELHVRPNQQRPTLPDELRLAMVGLGNGSRDVSVGKMLKTR